MVKKMMLLATALTALVAFAVPAVAQATQLTVTGGAVAVNSEVTATSTNLITTTAAGTLACKLVTIHATVTENSPHVTLVPTSTTTQECSVLQNGAPVTITKPTVGTITIFENEKKEKLGTSTATFMDDIPAAGLVDCHLSGSVAFTYASGSDVLTLPGSVLAGSLTDPEKCANAGVLEGSFTLEQAFLNEEEEIVYDEVTVD